MPNQLNINYTSLGKNTITPAVLADTAKMNEIADAMARDISNSLKNSLIADDMYSKIFVDGISITTAVNNAVKAHAIDALTLEEDKYTFSDDVQHKRLCAVFLAKAHILGQPVLVFPQKDLLDDFMEISATGVSLDLSNKKELTGWQKFWSFFGFYAQAVKEYNETEAQIHQQKDTLLSEVEQLSQNTISEIDNTARILKDNDQIINAAHKKYVEFATTVNDSQKTIEKQYLAETPPALLNTSSVYKQRDELHLADLRSSKLTPSNTNYTLCSAMMLCEKYTLEEISNPLHTEGRAAAGTAVAQLQMDLSSSDEPTKNAAEAKLQQLYINSASILLTQKIPSAEQYFDFTNSENANCVNLLHQLSSEFHKNMTHIKNNSPYSMLSNLENSLLLEKLDVVANAGVGKIVNECTLAKFQFDDGYENSGTINDLIFDALSYHAKTVTNLSGKTVDDFAKNNQAIAAKSVDTFDILKNKNSTIVKNYLDPDDDSMQSYNNLGIGTKKFNNMLTGTAEYINKPKNHLSAISAGEAFDIKAAKISLVNKTASTMFYDSKLSPAKLEERTVALFRSDVFENLTKDKTSTELNAMLRNNDFTENVIDGIAAKQRAKVVVKNANKRPSTNRVQKKDPSV